MPLSQITHVNDKIAYAIWDMSEPLSELEHLLEEINHEKVDLTKAHPKRIVEFITTRLLIRELCTHCNLPYEGIYKDEFGKPHLLKDNAFISISHSPPAAIGLINLSAPAGIDIEQPRDKIDRIKHKFLNETEIHHQDNLEAISLIWSAKETLYKIHGRKSLDFRKNLFVSLEPGFTNAKGTILTDSKEEYHLAIRRYNEFLFTFNI